DGTAGSAQQPRERVGVTAQQLVNQADPSPPAAVRARVLLLVPDYIWADGTEEVDAVGSYLEQRGIAYDRPNPGDSFDTALSTISGYPLAVLVGYAEDDFMNVSRLAALESYASQGGFLVVFKPVFAAGSAAHALTGTTATERRSDADALAFDGEAAAATR